MQQATACRSSSLTLNLQGSAAMMMTGRAQEGYGAPTSKKSLQMPTARPIRSRAIDRLCSK